MPVKFLLSFPGRFFLFFFFFFSSFESPLVLAPRHTWHQSALIIYLKLCTRQAASRSSAENLPLFCRVLERRLLFFNILCVFRSFFFVKSHSCVARNESAPPTDTHTLTHVPSRPERFLSLTRVNNQPGLFGEREFTERNYSKLSELAVERLVCFVKSRSVTQISATR